MPGVSCTYHRQRLGRTNVEAAKRLAVRVECVVVELNELLYSRTAVLEVCSHSEYHQASLSRTSNVLVVCFDSCAVSIVAASGVTDTSRELTSGHFECICRRLALGETLYEKGKGNSFVGLDRLGYEIWRRSWLGCAKRGRGEQSSPMVGLRGTVQNWAAEMLCRARRLVGFAQRVVLW